MISFTVVWFQLLTFTDYMQMRSKNMCASARQFLLHCHMKLSPGT